MKKPTIDEKVGQLRADKFLKFETNCLFAKGRSSKFKASELNLCKKPMGRRLSYCSFCQNLIVKIPRLVWQIPIF